MKSFANGLSVTRTSRFVLSDTHFGLDGRLISIVFIALHRGIILEAPNVCTCAYQSETTMFLDTRWKGSVSYDGCAQCDAIKCSCGVTAIQVAGIEINVSMQLRSGRAGRSASF